MNGSAALRKGIPELFLLLCCIPACERLDDYPVAAVDPVQDVLLVEDHSEVLLAWMQGGFRNKAIVLIDLHDDFRPVPEGRIRELSRLWHEHKWHEIEANRDNGAKSLFTLGDFLYPAHRIGIAKKIYWVTESPLLRRGDIRIGGRTLLRNIGYPERDIGTFRKEGHTLRGTLHGVDLTISTLDHLPVIREPVLLTIDADYFSDGVNAPPYSGLMVLAKFFQELQEKRIAVAHASVAYSVRGGYTEITNHHLAEETAQILLSPSLLAGGYPSSWRERDAAFSLLRAGRYGEALTRFTQAEHRYPREHSILLGKAIAAAMTGDDLQALHILASLTEAKPDYAYAYIAIGKLQREQDGLRACRYFMEYLRKNPESHHGLLALGNYFFNHGKYEAALNLFERVTLQFLDVNALMYSGDALMKLGRFHEAHMYYSKGLALLKEVGYRDPDDYPNSIRYMKLLNIYLAEN